MCAAASLEEESACKASSCKFLSLEPNYRRNMRDNLNTENDHSIQIQHPPRRPYKRISSQQWEEQKGRIQALYVEKDKPMAEVVQIMKDLHGFEAG
jgi:hypothetical protein